MLVVSVGCNRHAAFCSILVIKSVQELLLLLLLLIKPMPMVQGCLWLLVMLLLLLLLLRLTVLKVLCQMQHARLPPVEKRGLH